MSEPTVPVPRIGWTVQSQNERTVIGANGLAVNVITVTFILTNGTSGSVDIPVAAYNVTAVTDAINAKAATLAAVAALSG